MTERSSCKQFQSKSSRFIKLLVLLLLNCATASAESGYYRIEVLLFSHLDSDAEARQVDEITATWLPKRSSPATCRARLSAMRSQVSARFSR